MLARGSLVSRFFPLAAQEGIGPLEKLEQLHIRIVLQRSFSIVLKVE